jgi:cell filamentation protein
LTSFGGYDAFEDPYSYPGTNVLINKLGLRDPEQLEAFELEMTALRANEPLPDGAFDAGHYKAIHHHLFQDVYDWAGEYRNVRTAKGGNPFCFPEHIGGAMTKLFNDLASSNCFATEDSDEFVTYTAYFLGELNAIHPFREGNGRVQLAFVDLIGRKAGFPFDLLRVRRGTFIPAMIASYDGELQPLTDELGALLH